MAAKGKRPAGSDEGETAESPDGQADSLVLDSSSDSSLVSRNSQLTASMSSGSSGQQVSSAGEAGSISPGRVVAAGHEQPGDIHVTCAQQQQQGPDVFRNSGILQNSGVGHGCQQLGAGVGSVPGIAMASACLGAGTCNAQGVPPPGVQGQMPGMWGMPGFGGQGWPPGMNYWPSGPGMIPAGPGCFQGSFPGLQPQQAFGYGMMPFGGGPPAVQMGQQVVPGVINPAAMFTNAALTADVVAMWGSLPRFDKLSFSEALQFQCGLFRILRQWNVPLKGEFPIMRLIDVHVLEQLEHLLREPLLSDLERAFEQIFRAVAPEMPAQKLEILKTWAWVPKDGQLSCRRRL